MLSNGVFLTKEFMHRQVSLLSEATFLEEEVFNTKQRTGILIFMSLFEHEVQVIADKGINAKIDEKDWQAVVSIIIDGIKKDDKSRRGLLEELINAKSYC